MSETKENELTSDSLDEILNELEQEIKNEVEVNVVETELPPKKSQNRFLRNLKYCIYRPRLSKLAIHFQRLAGIKPDFVATVTLPNDIRVELQELPKWYDVIRYQVCGFKLKIYALEDNE